MTDLANSFYCPVCSGTHFGRYCPSDQPEIDEVSCHDEFSIGCTWRGNWSERLQLPNEQRRKWAEWLKDELAEARRLQRQAQKLLQPEVTFPITLEKIPASAKKIRKYISELQGNIQIAKITLDTIYKSCSHPNAEHGHNERDGSWMTCGHCGLST